MGSRMSILSRRWSRTPDQLSAGSSLVSRERVRPDCFRVSNSCREAGVEAGLQEERGEMEVAGRGEVGEVEVGDGHLRHDAGVGEDVTAAAVRQEDGYAGADGWMARDVGGVEAGCGEVREGDVAHVVGAELRGEADAGAEEREVVGEDGGRAAEGHGEGGGQELALGGQVFGEAVEDEVEVGFAGDGDVEVGGLRAQGGRCSRGAPIVLLRGDEYSGYYCSFFRFCCGFCVSLSRVPGGRIFQRRGPW